MLHILKSPLNLKRARSYKVRYIALPILRTKTKLNEYTEFYGIGFFKDLNLVDELVDRNVALPVPCTPYSPIRLCSHLLFPSPCPRLSRDTASLPPSTDNVRSLDTRGGIKYINLFEGNKRFSFYIYRLSFTVKHQATSFSIPCYY